MKARVSSDVGGASVVVGQQDRRGYCFEGITGAAEAAVTAVEQQSGWWLRPGRDEDRTRACAGVALLPPHMADQFTHGAQWGQVLAPALGSLLFVLYGVPCEEDEDEAHKLEAGGEAEVHKAK